MGIVDRVKDEGVMDNQGTVAYTDESFAYVNFERISSCGDSCASCSGDCAGKNHLVKVYNNLGAKKGDVVEVLMDGGDFLKMTFLLYGIPLIVLVLSAVGLDKLFGQTALAPVLAILACVASFFIINLFVKKRDDEGKTPVRMSRVVMRNLNNF